MNEISFIDTTLRDGQQSLWALNMKTDAMLGAAGQRLIAAVDFEYDEKSARSWLYADSRR